MCDHSSVEPSPLIVELKCHVCGKRASRVELRGPNGDGTWRFLYEGIEAGNGSGDDIPAVDAMAIARAFSQPLTFEAVHGAGLYDDAGMCSQCSVPYCHEHWNVSSDGFGQCPEGHGKSLDPHWSPVGDEPDVAGTSVQAAVVPKKASSWAQMESAARAGDQDAAKQLSSLYDLLRADGFTPRDHGPWTKDIAMWGGGDTLFQLDLVRSSEDGTYYLLWLGEKIEAEDEGAAIAAVEARYTGYGARRMAVDRAVAGAGLALESDSPTAAEGSTTGAGLSRHLSRKGYTRRAHGQWTKDIASWGVGRARLDLESVESEDGEGYFRLWLAETIPADDDAAAVAAVEERYISTDIELVVAAPADDAEVNTLMWYDQPPADSPTSCRSCGWSGQRSDLGVEPFEELVERSCPSCGAHLELVVYPTDEDTRAAAAAGVPEAIAALADVEHRAERAQHRVLQRPDELPDLPADATERLAVALEQFEGDDHWLVVKAGDHVLWRQPAFWEDVDGGEMLLHTLWARYGDQIAEIEVSPQAHMWFCGDRLSYVARIDSAARHPGPAPDQSDAGGD